MEVSSHLKYSCAFMGDWHVPHSMRPVPVFTPSKHNPPFPHHHTSSTHVQVITAGKGLPTASRSLDAALMKTLHRKLSNKSDGSEGDQPAKGGAPPEREPSGGSASGDKGAGGSDKGTSSAKPPSGKPGDGDEEVREKFRIVKVCISVAG